MARGFKIAHGKTGKALREATERVAALRQKRAALPQRVAVAEALGGAPVVKLAVERKHFTTVIKMVAYQIESTLVEQLRPYYARTDDEGRTLIQSALRGCAALEPTADELRVTVVPLSSPHRSTALRLLCDDLNKTATPFPGTTLRLRFAVAQSASS